MATQADIPDVCPTRRGEGCWVAEQAAREAGREAAEKAVREVFALIGVDVDRPEQVEAFREDLRLAKNLRQAIGHGFLALIAALATAGGTAAWMLLSPPQH